MELWCFRQSALTAAAKLKGDGVEIFTVGVTNSTDENLLAALSSGGQMNVDWFQTMTFEGLEEIRSQVIQQTCLTAPPTTLPPSTTSMCSTIRPDWYS